LSDHHPAAPAQPPQRYLHPARVFDALVVPKGKFLAIVSTTVETSTPELELRPALDLLGNVETKFTSISDLYFPTDAGQDGLFVSRSFDATSHFESVADDVLDMYKRITGTELDMSIPADLGDDDD
jgi:Rab GDP dissociation inhibitor